MCDAVVSVTLPVISTCGECGWYCERAAGAYGGKPECCGHAEAYDIRPTMIENPTARATDRYKIQRATSASSIPPAWCPLRAKKAK